MVPYRYLFVFVIIIGTTAGVVGVYFLRCVLLLKCDGPNRNKGIEQSGQNGLQALRLQPVLRDIKLQQQIHITYLH